MQWEVEPRAPLPSARSSDDLGTACLAPVHTARKGAKSSSGPNPRVGNALSPLGTVRNQLFLSEPVPKPGEGGLPVSPAPGKAPGAHLQRRRLGPAEEVPRRPEPGVLPPRLPKFRPPRLARCSCHKCTDCGHLRGARGTYPLSCSLMAARAPRTGEGKRMSELPRAAGSRKVERRRRPGSQPKALRRSGRGLAGRRPGGDQAGGERALRVDGAGPGQAPPPMGDPGTRTPADPALGDFQSERKEKRKKGRGGDLRSSQEPGSHTPPGWHPLKTSSKTTCCLNKLPRCK